MGLENSAEQNKTRKTVSPLSNVDTVRDFDVRRTGRIGGGGGFQMMADGRLQDGMEEPSRRSAFSALASAPHTLSRHTLE